MSWKSVACGLWIGIALVAGPGLRTAASEQGMFYIEVPKQGQIYVFASGQRYDAFQKSGGADIGTPVITRPGYGPNRETVVFDGEIAVNLYNFKHDLPGEYFPPKPEEKPKASYPSGKFSGLMFGDYYWYDRWHGDEVSPTEPAAVEGQEGFWLRRIHFTYDVELREKFTTRFRLEANSNGRFDGGNLDPYVKDAYLRWNFAGRHDATLGIQPAISIEWLEGFWGLRHVEKTPVDLYSLDSSRDFAITFAGPLPVEGLRYAAQLGNESGNGSEVDGNRIRRVELRYERDSGIALEALYSKGARSLDQDRTTAQGFAGYRAGFGRLGAQYVWQEREAGSLGGPDQSIRVWSGFGLWDFLPKRADLYARMDRVEGKLGGSDTGLPGADGIDYLILSPNAPFTNWIVGAEWYLAPSIRVGPNMLLVKYDDDPDPVNFPGRDEDRIYRLNFFWTF